MNFFQTILQRARALPEAALRLVSRLPLPRWAAPELTRAAAAGAILFAIAGAGLGARGGFSAFRLDAATAGATVSVGWGYAWLAWAAAGAAAGTVAGAASAWLAQRRWPQRAGLALLGIGALGGVLAGASWGSAVARERVVHVRAQPSAAAPIESRTRPTVSVVTGPVRLSGSVDRRVNLPLMAFMVLGGTVVGALAARGLADVLPLARREGHPPVLDDIGRPQFDAGRRGNVAHAGAF